MLGVNFTKNVIYVKHFLQKKLNTMINEAELREKMIACRKEMGVSRNDLSLATGIKPRTLVALETGSQKITIDILNKYIELNKKGYTKIIFDNFCNIDTLLTNKDLIPIPQYDISLSAGIGTYPDDHPLQIGTRSFSLDWIRKKGLDPKALKLLRIAGDSMEPLLLNRDIVMIDTSNIKASEGLAFACRLEGDLFIKHIQHTGDGLISLVSRNKAYNDIIINPKKPPDDFEIIGAVVWMAHSFI